MKINVGSKNKTKVDAVVQATLLYPSLFVNPEVSGVEVNIETFGHPKNLEETIKGSEERARQAFQNCSFSFGLEGGLISVPHTKTGFMEVGACAIYDGHSLVLGLSPAFEWPTRVSELILEGKADASQAFKQLGYTNHEKLGAVEGGIIGFLTRGRLTREDFSRYSILMAMVQLENPEMYSVV
ncbi:MAG: DUF84 family protein [Candidatus Doudnabacteria bacterium]|nr:DUF84 family protein [Candidatus Doudnabacteria bacterium]